jgi:transposase
MPLGKEKSSQIDAAACDGASGYLSSIKEHAKNALIVLDHFHVKSYLNDALDTVRKEELRQARKDKDTNLADLLLHPLPEEVHPDAMQALKTTAQCS